MRLDELTLTNFCQHTGTYKFSPFLTGIIGGNGSGKSNLMAAIRLLMTGENQNAGTLDMNINQAAPANARCNLKGTFVDGDTTYRVTRHLRPTNEKTTLEILRDGAVIENMIGDTKVTKWLREVAGASPETLKEYVLVSQGDIYSFLDQQPAKRAASFQRLFHLQPIEKAYDAVHKRIATTPIPEIHGDRDGVVARVQEAQDSIIRIDAALKSLPDTSDYENRLLALQTTIDDVRRQGSWLATKRASQQEVDAVSTQRTQLSATIMEDEGNLRSVEAGLAEFKIPAEEARVALATWDQRQQLVTARDDLVRRKEITQNALDAVMDPTTPSNMIPNTDIATARRLVRETVDQLADAHRLVTQFKDTGLIECPTCGTPVDTLAHKVGEAERSVPTLQQKAADMNEAIANSDIYNEQVAGVSRLRESHHATLSQLNEQLERLEPVGDDTAPDRKACQYRIDQYTTYERAITEFAPELRAKREQLVSLHAKYDSAVKSVENADAALADLTIDEAAAVRAPDAQARLRDAKTHKDTMEFDRRTAETQRVNADAELSRLDAQLPRIQEIANYVEHLEKLDALLHRDGLAKFVTHNRLQQLQIGVNQMLELFGVEFRVAANEALSFTATFMDGTVTPATRLSGGQQVVLAIAFRASVNSMFAGEVGMLMLDEPTVYLDREHIGRFTVVLQRLRELSASKGLQIILITHEEELAPLFDEVISL